MQFEQTFSIHCLDIMNTFLHTLLKQAHRSFRRGKSLYDDALALSQLEFNLFGSIHIEPAR